jgi:hypothetical protein
LPAEQRAIMKRMASDIRMKNVRGALLGRNRKTGAFAYPALRRDGTLLREGWRRR